MTPSTCRRGARKIGPFLAAVLGSLSLMGGTATPAHADNIARVTLKTGHGYGSAGANDKVWVHVCAEHLGACSGASQEFSGGDLGDDAETTKQLPPLSEGEHTPKWAAVHFERSVWDNWQLVALTVNTPRGRFCASGLPTWFEGDGWKNFPLHSC